MAKKVKDAIDKGAKRAKDATDKAAAATKKIKIGSGVCLVIERDPITLAKEIASLDALSGGRVIFGSTYRAEAVRSLLP